MRIKIQQNFSKNTAKVFFGEKQVDYNFRGPTIPHIFGYPYLDFLWLDENAKDGSEYTLETSNGFANYYDRYIFKRRNSFSF